MATSTFESEIGKLSQKFARNPDSRIFAPLAEAYRKAGRLGEAIDVAQAGLRHHPEFLSGRLVLARCYHDNGEFDLAAQLFHDVLSRDPQNVFAARALGEIARAQGRQPEAVEWYRRALGIEPGNLELQERLATLVAQPQQARDAWAAWSSGSEPGPPGESEVVVPRPGVEVPGSATGAEAEPAGEIATATLAEVYAGQGLHERALVVYRRLLAAAPDDVALRRKVDELEARSADAPWLFLLEEEQDHDPELVFAFASTSATPAPLATPGSARGAEPSSSPSAASGSRGREEGFANDAGTPQEDEDLREFREWLRNLR